MSAATGSRLLGTSLQHSSPCSLETVESKNSRQHPPLLLKCGTRRKKQTCFVRRDQALPQIPSFTLFSNVKGIQAIIL